MMIKKILFAVFATVLLGSCNIYKSYVRPDVNLSGIYRDNTTTDTTSLGNLPWREVFTDANLQSLIEQALDSNVDLRSAMLRVEQSQAMLTSARLAYTPSLGISPQGTVSSFDKSAATKIYTLPAVASWEIDIFGRLLNAKRGAKAALMQSQAYEQAVRTQVIASVANSYYSLLMLDSQLSISEMTAEKWRQSVATMEAMKLAGMVNEAAVVQSRANSYMIAATLPDLRRQVYEVENTISMLIGKPVTQIKRSKLAVQQLPTTLSTGIPLQLLSNRPDVKASEMALAGTTYNTAGARSAFYPQITLNGTLGWTNNAGSMIVNPGKLIASAVGSLVQPIFNKGANKARLKVAKAQQQEALLNFQQSILNAGIEVNNALFQYQTATQKSVQRTMQIEALNSSVAYTEELLRLGSSTYLEVLTAQQSLLSAQLSEVSDSFQKAQAVVNLYHALGGGR